jgi:exonuclease III
MRIVTWNCCRGTFARKAALLGPLEADVAVLQEIARPDAESDHCLWFGHNPRQGIAVVAREPYSLAPLPRRIGTPRYVIPIEVSGPTHFTMLAVWAKGAQRHPYVEGVIRAVRLYRHLFEQTDAVLLGDLNSNPFWDHQHADDRNHTALVRMLSDAGLVSAYHEWKGEQHGQETTPTYYFLWKEERPYHIDYCFLPRTWLPRVRLVEIGSFVEWKGHSDHRPLLVDIHPA